MYRIPIKLKEELRQVLLENGRADLWERLERYLNDELLTSSEAAQILGLSSPTTIKNWQAAGHLPGAFQTKGGHWRF